MKGVVLAGGTGSRLMPCTMVTNKHLLPVYDRPMVYYPIQLLVESGITDIMVVTGGNSAGHFFNLLKNGEAFGLDGMHYAYQEGSGGIAEALKLAKPFVGDDKVCVVLGDNIFEHSFKEEVVKYERQDNGAMVVLSQVSDPQRFGVAMFDGEEELIAIEEKPVNPPSHWAVTGIYFYDSQVWGVLDILEPSGRGELEISDVNNWYLAAGQLSYCEAKGWWSDAGTHDSLLRAASLVKEHGALKQLGV